MPGESATALETHFAFAADGGSMERATERCVGVGACRKTEGGVMCPSYRATGEERHSTRGRARLLWEMLAGALREEGFQSEAVHEALDLCLSCKACKTECPVQVDMAAYKSEFLAQRYKGKLHPLHHYIFGFADKLARWGSITPALTNAVLTGPITSPLIKRVVGVAQQRELPRLAKRSYQKAESRRCRRPTGQLAPARRWCSGPIPGTTTTIRRPSTPPNPSSPRQASRLKLPRGHICCGRPLYDFGLLDAARNYLGQSSQPDGPADRRRTALHLSGAKLRQRLQGRTARALPQRPSRKKAQPADVVAGRLAGRQSSRPSPPAG